MQLQLQFYSVKRKKKNSKFRNRGLKICRGNLILQPHPHISKQNVFQFFSGWLCNLNNDLRSMGCLVCDLLNSKWKLILHKLHHVEVYWPHRDHKPNLNFCISLTNQMKWTKEQQEWGPCREPHVFSYSKIFSLLKQNDSLQWGPSWASKTEYQVFPCSEAKQLCSSQ